MAYVDLLDRKTDVCREICGYCGVPTEHEFGLERARVRKQRTALNDDFRDRFARESSWRLA